MSNNNVIEDKKQEAQSFVEKYDKLCKETGYKLVTSPAWIARDDGTFSLVIQITVGEIPKEAK